MEKAISRLLWICAILTSLLICTVLYRMTSNRPHIIVTVSDVVRESLRQETSPNVILDLPQQVIDRVRSVVLFIGHPHSGHSIVGSILDSHPHIVVSHELDLFNNMDAHPEWNKSVIFNEIWKVSKTESQSGLRTDSKQAYRKGYSLLIPNLYQGTYESYIDVIGDKRGGRMTHLIIDTPEHWKQIYDRLKSVTRLPVKMFHVIRNPFDNIATMVLFTAKKNLNAAKNITELKQEGHINPLYSKFINGRTSGYFKLYQAIEDAKRRFDLGAIEVHVKDLIADPKKVIGEICNALQVICDDHFINVCSDKIFPKESKTRYQILWKDSQIKDVQSYIKQFSNLHRYIEFDS